MKLIVSLSLLSLFSACSTNQNKDEFSIATNCSQRAQEQLEKYQTPKYSTEDEERKNTITMKEITAPIAMKAADKCFYDSKIKYESTYNVCPLISTDKKGRLIFIDVEDNANPLPVELKKCLLDAFSQGDYTKLPSKTFGQPLTLTPTKRKY
jgi:hypothetical protein